jgi:hypothetical protein
VSTFLLLIALLLSPASPQNTKPPSKTEPACNGSLSFCWSDTYVEIKGNRWVSQDASEKPLVQDTLIHCFKEYKFCFMATDRPSAIPGINRIYSDLLQIVRWNDSQIIASSEDAFGCGRNTYILSRSDRNVVVISGPGPNTDRQVCTEPKTITYRLVDDFENATRGPQRK